MKVIAQRGEDYLLAPDEAEPDDNADGVIVQGDSADSVNIDAALARGYWQEPSGDVDASELLPESIDTGLDSDDSNGDGEESIDTTKSVDTETDDGETVTVTGLSKDAIEFIKRRFNADVEEETSGKH